MAITLYEQKFMDTLAEIFQMNQADLDFGIYRIMNQKRKDIEAFLNNRLVPEVTTILKTNASQKTDLSAMENEVFSHLTKFFSRYYEGGDFVSKRRYKDDAYAIPYSGEEVKLYWANADQYYIKTSEYFKNYAFVLPTSRRKVHFVLRDAETEQNNNKAANNMERRFQLCEEDFIAVEKDELNIYFTYELMPKGTKQEALIKAAEETILPMLAEPQYAGFEELTSLAPTEKNKNRTLLLKHLQDYTAKNNFDYFIHKDLGGFLRRELDFYIKNEVMFLDDLDANHILEHLAQVKAIKQVGEKIIAFLAQLEDFQKKLWLKKKFVVGCDYCITLDRIPRTLYPEIIANDAQRQEWVRLFAIDEIKGDMMTEGYSEPLTEKFLEENPFLVLDTKFFSVEFKHKLVGSMDNVDEECNGLLINSENFQALELLQEKYREAVKCVYIDPPYNTDASKIAYKNGYEHSSWISLMDTRLQLLKLLLEESGVIEIAIDDYEMRNLNILMDQVFGINNALSNIAIFTNPKGRDQAFVAQAHDYSIIYAKDKRFAKTFEFSLSSEELKKKFSKVHEGNISRDLPLKRTGSESTREERPYMFFPFLWNGTELSIITKEELTGIYNKETNSFNDDYLNKLEEKYKKQGYSFILPLNRKQECLRWRWGYDSCVEGIKNGTLFVKASSMGCAVYQHDLGDDKYKPKSFWIGEKYDASSKGTNLLENILPNNEFDYPKSLYTVMDNVRLGACYKDYILDSFAGSGTTGHAVINLNREDKGKRKYILCDMAHYFKTVLKPRIEKVIYSEDWKDGKPVSRKGISQCFKYIRLEQYEDTLNNLQLKQQHLDFKDEEGKGRFEETYLLRYMLDTETKGDLFNLEWFVNPFAMTLKTTKDNELIETPVDMVETFNYLIGLNVETLRYPKDGYCVVEGYTHIGNEKTLVIWRDCNKVSNEALNEFFRKQAYCTTDSEFDKIYVNGDNTLPNIKTDEEHWKVVLIEEEFKKRMFE